MEAGLESLSAKEYPGRVIIIGRDSSGEKEVGIYVITGRSTSSQARKLDLEGDTIWAKPIDEEALKEENIDLLVYPAIFLSRRIAISNGRQTEDIKASLDQSQNPAVVLISALHNWEYEPDEPHFTPRISGCVIPGKKAALSIIKRTPDGSPMRYIFEFPLTAGKGKMIATYEGENKDPLPSFLGEPIEVEIKEGNAKGMAEAVYRALEPKDIRKDYRVAVACVFSEHLSSDQYDIYIINRHERTRK